MPATRSRTSTEQPEVALEDVKNSDLDEQNEDKSVDKSEEENNENTTSTTTDEKEVEESEDNSDANDSKDANDANGDQLEEKVENGSSKRKSEAGEGDVPDSTDILAKKARVEDESDAAEGDAPVEQSV